MVETLAQKEQIWLKWRKPKKRRGRWVSVRTRCWLKSWSDPRTHTAPLDSLGSALLLVSSLTPAWLPSKQEHLKPVQTSHPPATVSGGNGNFSSCSPRCAWGCFSQNLSLSVSTPHPFKWVVTDTLLNQSRQARIRVSLTGHKRPSLGLRVKSVSTMPPQPPP